MFRISSYLYNKLTNEPLYLSQRFNHSINFLQNENLISFHDYTIPMNPTSIQLESFDSYHFNTIDIVDRIIQIDNKQLPLNKFEIFNTQLQTKLKIEDLYKFKITPSNESFIYQWLNKTPKDNFSNYLSMKFPDIQTLKLEDLYSLIGFGIGLTPSMDDFIIGIWFVFDLLNIKIDKTVNLNSTTTVSKAFLKAAQETHYSSLLLNLGDDLKLHIDPKSTIDKISKVGHSSGKETLLGIDYAINYLLKHPY